MYDKKTVVYGLELVKEDICERFVSGSQKSVDCLRIDKAIAMLKEQKAQKFIVDESGKITPLPVVVRCKDCVYWDKGHTENCDNSDSVCFHNGWCKPDWFCADGERKEP